MKEQYSQIRTVFINNSLQIFVKQNNFLAGEIDLTKGVFYSIPRSSKNLFHLFHGKEGGLGLNEEILLMTTFDIIKIKYCEKILCTSRLKWLNKGIVSPYCNQTVDKQIILGLSEINLIDSQMYNHIGNQTNLFQEVLL